MLDPIHVGTILVGPVRFFCSPLDDGRPDLPWHAQDDLARALGLPAATIGKLRSRFIATHPDAFYNTRTAAGMVPIAPNFAAMEMVLEVLDRGKRKLAIADHLLEATAALKALVAPMPMAARAAYPIAAFARWEMPGRAA